MPSDLQDPAIRPLWQSLADRLARGCDPAAIKTTTVHLTRDAQALIAGWLAHSAPGGRRRPLQTNSNGTTIPVPRLLTALGYTPHDLRTLIENAGIDIPDTAGTRTAAHLRRTAIDTYAACHLPDTPLLNARLRSYGISEETIEERRFLIDCLARVRTLLPLPRPLPLAILADRCTGDPHYFDLNDNGRGALLILLARDLLHAQHPDTPADERKLLTRLGIVADRLSQTVLLLNVKATGNGPTDRALNLAWKDRRPLHLTLHDLTAHPPALDADQNLLVVENTSLIDEALERHVTRPLACTRGNLSAVDHTLLALAQDTGLTIEYAGDHDPWGHAIADTVRRRYQATPVAMDAAAHRAAIDAEPDWRRSARLRCEPADAEPLQDRIYQENSALIDILLGPDRDLWPHAARPHSGPPGGVGRGSP
ncbi:TIGR02679 domain-containing protein [Streptomyces sp. NPDC055815]